MTRLFVPNQMPPRLPPMVQRFDPDALDMLVGQAAPGMMVPGAAGGCGPWYPPYCSPCPPGSGAQAAQEAAYQLECARMAAMAQRGARADAIVRSPQVLLPVSSRAAGVAAPGVAAGATLEINVSPQVSLCLTKFVVSRVSSPFFIIRGFSSGMENYISSGGSFPADVFAPDAEEVPPISLPTVYPGTQVTMTVENITAEPHEFWANLWGLRLTSSGPCL